MNAVERGAAVAAYMQLVCDAATAIAAMETSEAQEIILRKDIVSKSDLDHYLGAEMRMVKEQVLKWIDTQDLHAWQWLRRRF